MAIGLHYLKFLMISFRKHHLEKLCKIGKFQFTQSEHTHTILVQDLKNVTIVVGLLMTNVIERESVSSFCGLQVSALLACAKLPKRCARGKKDIRVPSATKYGGEH
jgi:hypothetical protein